MPDSNPSEYPVRVVYHAGDRTFARLFNERSLDEVKDVVRRKLGLGSQTDVSLKQMGHDALLDLEDDDDFQAFRVLLSSSVSVDIKVTVGGSLGSTVPPPVSRGPVTHSSRSEPTTTTSSALPSGVVSPGKLGVRPEVVRTTEASTTPAKTSELSKRKRKVSFDGAATPVTVESTGQHALAKPAVVTPAASAKVAGSPAAPKLVASEEPPKKRQRKEPIKTKTKTTDVQVTDIADSPTLKASVSKPKSKKSTTLDRGSKAEISAPKVPEASEPLVKRQRRQKKDDSAAQKRSSIPVGLHDIDVDPPSSAVNGAPLQLELGVESDTPKSRRSGRTKAPKGTACAAIPQTSASVSVQSEVAAAILSLSNAGFTLPLELPTKRKSVKRVTKKSSGSSKTLPTEPTTVLVVPANEVSNAPAEHGIEQEALTNELPPQRADLNGPDAIRERLEELKRTDTGDQHSLTKQLEDLLRDPEVMSMPSLDAAPTDNMQSGSVSPDPRASFLKTPNTLSNSHLSEVIVESRGEGSSPESSDDLSEGRVEHQEFSASRRQETQDDQPSPSDGDIEAIVRGPASKKQSVLQLLDRIVGDEDGDADEDIAELEDDSDKETGRLRRLPSGRVTRSSDSESEADSRSSLPLRLAEDTSNNSRPDAHSPKKSGKESAGRRGGDVVMRDSVGAPVSGGQDDDDSEETHVGLADHIVIAESTGEKNAAIVAVEQSTFPVSGAPAAQNCDAPRDELQESTNVEVEPTPNHDDSVPAVVGDTAADPIEPADDLVSPNVSRSSNADSIEVPFEDIDSEFPSVASSTPKPGVSRRIKNRSGRIPDDEADRPVLLEQLDLEVTDKPTPTPPKGKSRRKVTEMPTSLEPTTTRRSGRVSSLSPSTSAPAVVVLLNHRSKSGKAVKTPAKQSEEHITPTPSLIQWETLAEPSSPSVQLDQPLVLVDELMSSSPHPDGNLILERPNGKGERGRTLKAVASSGHAESSQKKERLFDQSSSQIPFPYSQIQINSAAAAPSGKDGEETTESEDEPRVTKKRMKTPARYRPLSQLASQATLFSPGLPTPMPTKTSVSNREVKRRAVVEDTSSSSSDADEGDGLEHIPRERRAGSMLEAKKRKGLLSAI